MITIICLISDSNYTIETEKKQIHKVIRRLFDIRGSVLSLRLLQARKKNSYYAIEKFMRLW